MLSPNVGLQLSARFQTSVQLHHKKCIIISIKFEVLKRDPGSRCGHLSYRHINTNLIAGGKINQNPLRSVEIYTVHVVPLQPPHHSTV